MSTARFTKPIDFRAPGAIEQLLAFHRHAFGDARMEDGAGDGASGQGSDAGQGGGEAGQQAAGASQDSQQAGQQQGGEGKVEDLPDWAQRIIRETRQEAAGNRTKATEAEAKSQQTLDAIASALGLKKGEDAPSADQLARQLADSQTDGKATKVELAVLKAALKGGADPLALTDSRAFMTKVADLDPSAKDFADKVKAEIEAAVKDNPKLKAARAAGASSVEHPGGSGENHDPASTAQPGQARLAAAYANSGS